jgi:AcrR family transcriptional regulator
MTGTGWLREERSALAIGEILDAAGELFAERGVASVGMAEVAEAAGCSRATLYRYFDGRDALRTAFVHRETTRVAAEVARHVEGIRPPRRRVVEGVIESLRLVRDEPVLASWFSADDVGSTARLAQSSELVETLAAGLLGAVSDPTVRRRARWVVRVIVSFLADPEPDPADERALIEEFLAPVVIIDT